jgi:hypothetical protein
MERKILNTRGFSRAAAEDSKFTNLGFVGVASNPAPKTEITYDVNGNPTQVDVFSGAANRVNLRFPETAENCALLAGKYVTLDDPTGAHLYYLWFFVGGSGSNPSLPGRTGIQVTSAANAASLTAATVSALNSSAAASYFLAKSLDTFNISVYHKDYGAVVQPASNTNFLQVTNLRLGENFGLASRTSLEYDGDGNPTSLIRVEF